MAVLETKPQRWPRWQVLLVFALAMALRMTAANLYPMDRHADPDAYLQLGSELS